jgi:predicted ATPase/class 3 adenylate cyclase
LAGLPTGTVTFLFTDIEGSTMLLQRLGDRRYAEVLAEHRHLLRAAFVEEHGQEIDTQGDAFAVAFSRARDAVAAALAGQLALMTHAWPDGSSLRVRMGLHTGEPVSETGSYVGLDVHRAARICAAGHGGQILLSDAVRALAAPDLPPSASLRDLGAHRLKDLREPEHLFQVVHPDLPADFPSLKSLDARSNNLPIQLTSFIGREREMAEVKRLLGVARLVTLTGSGGAGKTRLALQVAADVVEAYPDGVWLTEFAPIADPALVPKTVASALNVPEQPGRDMIETLVDVLRPKALLLLLDNCEHLLAACRDLVAMLLHKCPQVRILATSREGLGIAGETLWRVPSLSVPEDIDHLPSSEELVLYDAIRLFIDRAVATVQDFTVTSENGAAVAQVCRRLDGIPLAIELAAARVKVLAVEQIAARLDDRFRLLTGGSRAALPRHQTLRAAMDWSYGLLLGTEQIMLRRLSVFAGGCTLDAAEAVCSGGDVAADEVLDLLSQLVDKSLVGAETQHGAARYQLLETVRQYGWGRLLDSREAAEVQRRHRDWYLALAERAEPELGRAEQDVWLERLATEHDNLRAALEWSRAEQGGADAELRLAGALQWFWGLWEHWSEGRGWLETALTHSRDAPPAVLAKVYRGAAYLAWHQGDFEQATIHGEKGLALSKELGDKEGSALLLRWLGLAAAGQGDPERATALLEASLALDRELGDKGLISMELGNLAGIAKSQGDDERAAALLAEALTLSKEAGIKWTSAVLLASQGWRSVDQGNYGQAEALFKESLTLSGATLKRFLATDCLIGLHTVAAARGAYDRAARLFSAAHAARDSLGRRLSGRPQANKERFMTSLRAALGDTAFEAAWAEGRAMTLEHAIEYALADESRSTLD